MRQPVTYRRRAPKTPGLHDEVRISLNDVHLAHREAALVAGMMAGHCRKRPLLEFMFGADNRVSDRYLRELVGRTRKRLAGSGFTITDYEPRGYAIILEAKTP